MLAIIRWILLVGLQNVLQRWVGNREQFATLDEVQRYRLRAPTIFQVVKRLVDIAIGLIGLVSLLIVLKATQVAWLVIAFIIGLSSQGLIKKAIAGLFILLQDQYLIGDVIQIGDRSGLVERMNLLSTQLRSAGGELVTIQHDSFDTVVKPVSPVVTG